VVKRRSTIWPIQPHTQAKHALLRRYLDAWLPIITRRNSRALYIDGFSGPGRYAAGEDGSPIIALKAALEHRAPITAEVVYLFIEADPERKAHLDQELARLALPGNIEVHTREGYFDEALTGLLDDLSHSGGQLIPTFAFADPFGFSHTPFQTIARLLSYPHCEMLINFMHEEVNRFLSHPDHAATLDRLFGTPDWREIVPMKEVAARRRMIHDLYDGSCDARRAYSSSDPSKCAT
jgi:three-Cys-motif partner protein